MHHAFHIFPGENIAYSAFIPTDLSRDLLHSPDHGNVAGIEHADTFDVISWNNEVVVVPGRPVVTEGHVFVIGEEELGICRIDSLLTRRQLIGLTAMSR